MNQPTQGELSACRKHALATGRAVFFRDGNATVLVVSSLIAAMAAFLPTVLISWTLTYLVDWDVIYMERPILYGALSVFESVLTFAFSFFTVFPLYLGVYRIAVRIMKGELPQIFDVFCYFTGKGRYRRAIMILVRLLLRLIAPYLCCSFLLRLLTEGSKALVVLLLVPLGMVVLGLTVFLFAVSLGFVTHAVSDDERPLADCLSQARRASKGMRGSHMLFVFSLTWRMLLSLIPVGVPLLIYMLPVALLALPNYVWRCEMSGNGTEIVNIIEERNKNHVE